MMRISEIVIITILAISLVGCSGNSEKDDLSLVDMDDKIYHMPDEAEEHEGTWLQWPHRYTYGSDYKSSLEPIWVEMTKVLSINEKVHIVAYNASEKEEIQSLLINEGVLMENIDFYLYQTDDVWARDNGPIFVFDEENKMFLLDWNFNGWGEKVSYSKDRILRESLAEDLNFDIINLDNMVLEGGSIEMDASGTLITTRSAVTNQNRNPNLTELEIEEYLSKYYAITNYIWLDGVSGIDITDFHIDGFVKFLSDKTLLTLNNEDLMDWGVTDSDIDVLLKATNSSGEIYDKIYLPLTKNNVVLENGNNLGYKGSYLNYYVANGVILVPNYNDSNDSVANEIIAGLYPERVVIGIDVRELYQYGGMIHCVTQQQPKSDK